MKQILETERLILRQFTADDTSFIIELVNTPGWLEFIGDRNIKSNEQAIDYLEKGPIKSYELNGYGLSLVVLKNGVVPIGMCGLIKRDYLQCPDIGFAFLPGYTGKGLAFEIANATMAYAWEELKLPEVLAITLPKNIASIKLLEKIGMKACGPFYAPNDKEELLLYSSLPPQT